MPLFRRNRSRTTFHITDVEEFYANLRDGNHSMALARGVRILDRALNGPPAGLEKGFATEHPIGETEQKKLKELSERIAEIVGAPAMESHGDEETHEETTKSKWSKKAKEEKDAADVAEGPLNMEGGDAGDNVIGAIPWALILQIALAVLEALKNWQK